MLVRARTKRAKDNNIQGEKKNIIQYVAKIFIQYVDIGNCRACRRSRVADVNKYCFARWLDRR